MCHFAKFSCNKYKYLEDRSSIVVPKEVTDCQKLGPVTSGFNQAACDIFQTWCQSKQNCFGLVKCINDLKKEAEQSRTRKAYFQYLDGALEVNDADGETDDPNKCKAFSYLIYINIEVSVCVLLSYLFRRRSA